MSDTVERLKQFIAYRTTLKGDEKGEAQVFCDRLFQAFGHAGYKEAGATLEYRVRDGKRTKFADLLWRPRLLLEMKSHKENLNHHYRQALEYWYQLVPHRPRYVVLCNFNEFWVYDFDQQLHEPVDKIAIEELPQRYLGLNFLFPDDPTPQFGNDRIGVTRNAADKVAAVFNSMQQRVERDEAQRFALQCVVAMFSEDIDLLPRGLFTALVSEGGHEIAQLFRQMNSEKPGTGRFKDVRYFNGGLFANPAAIELTKKECELLGEAADENWSKVEPGIFGTLFQSSMDKKKRHAKGAHFTSEAEIQRVVLPTIVRPWTQRIAAARTLKELLQIRADLLSFRVLDPACGSGNFLYLAYRELKRLELDVVAKIHADFGSKARSRADTLSRISTKQFFGFDIIPFAVELAKVTLMLGRKLAIDEAHDVIASRQANLPLSLERPLPLPNLDTNIRCEDALFARWPKVDAIIGNPPYQSKNKSQKELSADYMRTVHERYPGVPGRADYCVYWFRRAHDELKPGGRAGLVGTNTIRQNYSREGGLDYIVATGGTITEAVSTEVWPGEAVVHVSIVNWIKGDAPGLKKLYSQVGDQTTSPWKLAEFPVINSQLSFTRDVSSASRLQINADSSACYQGQTHGHEGFLLTPDEARDLVQEEPEATDVLFPYLTADDLLSRSDCSPSRWVIDFHPRDIVAASDYKRTFARVRRLVLPAREEAAKQEAERNAPILKRDPTAHVNHHHANFLKRWWLLSYPREEMVGLISGQPRYIVCGQVTKRPIFEFVSLAIRPNAALIVFPLADDYSFGILQSGLHWAWFNSRCSTMKGDPRYTSDSVFDSFPWPQGPATADVKRVAKLGRDLRDLRRRLIAEHETTLRELYRTLELPGEHELKSAQEALDAAVLAAYGMRKNQDPLDFLLTLNHHLAERACAGKPVRGPGLPAGVNPAPFVSSDCVPPPKALGRKRAAG